MKIQIKGGRVVDPGSGTDKVQDVFVAAGKIVALGAEPGGFHANRLVDAAGLVVCPGLVDLSARLREPGYEYKATLESEMAAAVAGGRRWCVRPTPIRRWTNPAWWRCSSIERAVSIRRTCIRLAH